MISGGVKRLKYVFSSYTWLSASGYICEIGSVGLLFYLKHMRAAVNVVY